MNRRKTAALVLDVLIAVLIGVLMIYTYRLVTHPAWRWGLIAVLAAAAVRLGFYERSRRRKSNHETRPQAGTLHLLGEQEKVIRSWDLAGRAGHVIGKASHEHHVDIDLSNTAYQAFIDDLHAVVNYTVSGWWIEDVGSRNGTSILRKGETLLLAQGVPSQIYPGDIILLADNTRLAVK